MKTEACKVPDLWAAAHPRFLSVLSQGFPLGKSLPLFRLGEKSDKWNALKLIPQMKGGWSGMRRIGNLEATITEQEQPVKIPEACHEALEASKRQELAHQPLKHKCQTFFFE